MTEQLSSLNISASTDIDKIVKIDKPDSEH